MHATVPRKAASSDEGRPDPVPTDSMTAVLAHGMLGSMAVIGWGVDSLASRTDAAETATVRCIVDMVRSQIELVTDLLADLARGLPPDAVDYLEQHPRA